MDVGRGWMSNNAIFGGGVLLRRAELRAARGKNGAYIVEDGGFHFNVILKQDEYEDHICND